MDFKFTNYTTKKTEPKTETQEDVAPKENVEEDESLFETNWTKSVDNFEDLKLKKNLIRGVYGIGLVKPSVIQQKGILPVILRKDTIVQAQPDSEKTITFSIGVLQNINEDDLRIQALIVSPTRELATQIADVVGKLGHYLNVKVSSCVRDTNVVEEKNKLKEGCHIVVGIPGRIKEMINEQFLSTNFLKMLVIDEADKMLDMGFLEQINEIIKIIPPDCQIALFSSTISPDIIKLTKDIMNDPAKILDKKGNLNLEGIKQYYLNCSTDENKYEKLLEIFNNIDINQCIIYCNTKEKAKTLAEKMTENDFMVSCISSELPEEKCIKIMKEFKDSETRILVSTDLLARSIYVQHVGMVINFELPFKIENYIIRIGRSGRYGRRSIAINLVSHDEATYLSQIQEFYQTQISELPNDLSELE